MVDLSLTPNVVDVPLATVDQTPPAHAGPIGRIQSLKNAEVVHYLPPQARGAGGGASPQITAIQQREGFVSLSDEIRDVTDGTEQAGFPFPPAELLSTLGDQLLSIADSRPKVWNGAAWSQYTDTRVLTGKLSQDIFHTSNRTIQASDSAQIGDVTCFVWTETFESVTGSYVGFKSADGAWIRTPTLLYQSSDVASIALAKTRTDGVKFWVVFDNATSNLTAHVYNTHGEQIASTTTPRTWTTSPGFWDIVITSAAQTTTPKLLIAQPGAFTPGSDVGVKFTRMSEASGTITAASNTDATVHCMGPLAWLTNEQGGSDFQYLATVAPGLEGTVDIDAYEVDTSTMAQTHEYLVVTNFTSGPTIDAMTGYIISASGIGVVVAVSRLSDYEPADGPPNDPGLRNIRVDACTRAGAQVFIKQANGVVLQSRAFHVATSPPEEQSHYAVTYYQSGGGLQPGQASQDVVIAEGDQMTGALDQPLDLVAGDLATGADHIIPTTGSLFYTPLASFAGANWTPWNPIVGTDSIDPDSGLCEFTTIDFGTEPIDTPVGSYLHITGSAHTTNNQDYLITGRTPVAGHHFITIELVGSAGHTFVSDDLTGVTASIVLTVALWIPEGGSFGNGVAVPAELSNQFNGGSFTIAGAANSVNNATYTTRRLLVSSDVSTGGRPISSTGAPFTIFIATKPGSQVEEGFAGTCEIAPVFPNDWVFAVETFSTVDEGNTLVVEGAHRAANNGEFTITDTLLSVLFTQDADAAGTLPEFFTAPLPTMTIHLTVTPYTFTFANVTFDDSYIGAFITISGAQHAANDGVYVIDGIVSAHVVTAHPATGSTGQRNELFGEGAAASILRTTNPSPAYQPCWFITPLSVTQQTAGKFEYGIAYADWRFDGATTDPAIGTDFNRNNYPLALSSVGVASDLVSRSVVLPYRAQSFTAGQTIRSNTTGNITGIAAVAESTVGLKSFTLAGATFGQAVANSGEMLLPGPMAAAFTASGFHEDGVNLGFEAPFYVSQSHDTSVIGITPKSTVQYVVVAEVMDENGDRTFMVQSPPLTVTLTGDNNSVVIGGRTIGPTNRPYDAHNIPTISTAIYRTATVDGVPTVQHYKITNDLDINGDGFSFFAVTGAPHPDSWEFTDKSTDGAIINAEQLYTDKGLVPRFPAPAFFSGVGSWCNRTWVIGYDGAVWMSGEKTEGDAVWFTPLFRYVLPTDDKPVTLAFVDEYMLVFCSRSIWYIPKTDFPSATLQSGSLPTPVQLPFQNGCTGWATTIKAGAAYASTAGGVWLITRQLTNVWLSQAVQDDLDGKTVTTLAINRKQRLFVMTGTTSLWMFDQVAGCWSEWRLPLAAQLGAILNGELAYQDLGNPGHVAVQTPGVFADTIGTTTTGVPPDVQLAGISFANVRAYKRTWAIQIVGQYKGPHNLNVVVSYPDEDQDPTTYEPFTPAADEAYVYEVNPDPEEASTYSVRLFADFDGVDVPANSFLLELLSFETGIEPGINRLTSTKRIPSNG